MAAAAILVVALGSLWFLIPARARVIARLEQVDGEVYIVTGQVRQLATVGQELRSGQGLETVGEESGAVVVDRNAMRLVVGPDSTLGEVSEDAAGRNSGKRVSLMNGSLSADGTGLPEGRPMVVVTAQARVALLLARPGQRSAQAVRKQNQ